MEKIKMVVKCIRHECLSLTNNKYYPVINEHNCSYSLINDLNYVDSYCKSRFITFKVGDKFKSDQLGQTVEIQGFEECQVFGIKYIHVCYSLLTNIENIDNYWTINAFDRLFTKIEEPELLPVGTKVRVSKFMSLFIGQEGIITDLHGKFQCLVEFEHANVWFNITDLQKLEDPKPEWQPKFKVGDWVLLEMAEEVVKITSIDLENRFYKITRINGQESCRKWFDHELKEWKPMQELKDKIVELEKENAKLTEGNSCLLDMKEKLLAIVKAHKLI